jgi:rhamnulokinase
MAAGELNSLSDMRQLISQSFPVDTFTPEDSAAWQDAYTKYKVTLGL